jgi:hypothetical protein
MRCLECGAEFDEMNESQPVCPGCGSPPGMGRDDAEIGALLDEALSLPPPRPRPENPMLGSNWMSRVARLGCRETYKRRWMTPRRFC